MLIFSGCDLQYATGSGGPELVWSDEFNGSEVDPSRWNTYVGDGCPGLCGFGNNELQYYSDRAENVSVKDGKLIITAIHDSLESRAYSSAKLLTKDLKHWKYGRIEVMAKLPQGKGTWPAIWMLPEEKKYGGWPRSGEIDIMEHVGYNPGMIYGTVHTESFNHMKGTQKGDSIMVADASQSFHEYAIEWRKDQIDWFIDGEPYHSFRNTGKNSDDWPFDQPFHLILNLAVGGSWGGSRGIDDSIWPQSMEIDYVRVYSF
ncbi:MAG: hypothetical protein Roseis2KO_29550 [Roseivirga sp.]